MRRSAFLKILCVFVAFIILTLVISAGFLIRNIRKAEKKNAQKIEVRSEIGDTVGTFEKMGKNIPVSKK